MKTKQTQSILIGSVLCMFILVFATMDTLGQITITSISMNPTEGGDLTINGSGFKHNNPNQDDISIDINGTITTLTIMLVIVVRQNWKHLFPAVYQVLGFLK
jgi:hypothetical protein